MSEPTQKKSKSGPVGSLLVPRKLYDALFFPKAGGGGGDKSAFKNATNIRWSDLRKALCPLPEMEGRSASWMPWFPSVGEVTGYYLDESSRDYLQTLYARHSCLVDKEEEKEEDADRRLLLQSWFAFPRLILNQNLLVRGGDEEEDDDDEDTAPSPCAAVVADERKRLRLSGRGFVDDQKRFIPRAFVSGQSVLLPYIWLKLSDDGKSVTVRESTIVASGYRIALASSANGYRLASVHLPVYRRFPRQLAFSSDPVKWASVTFEGANRSYMLEGGSKALLGRMIAKEDCLAREEDYLQPVFSDGGEVRRLEMEFRIDLIVRFNDETGQFDGVTGAHASPRSMYYVLVEHLGRHCLYAFHADDFRGPGEETGLDLHYPHPLSVI